MIEEDYLSEGIHPIEDLPKADEVIGTYFHSCLRILTTHLANENISYVLYRRPPIFFDQARLIVYGGDEPEYIFSHVLGETEMRKEYGMAFVNEFGHHWRINNLSKGIISNDPRLISENLPSINRPIYLMYLPVLAYIDIEINYETSTYRVSYVDSFFKYYPPENIWATNLGRLAGPGIYTPDGFMKYSYDYSYCCGPGFKKWNIDQEYEVGSDAVVFFPRIIVGGSLETKLFDSETIDLE